MKKITLAIVAFAAMVLASCGGSTKAGSGEDTLSVDTTSFEQEQVEAAIKMHIDSLVAQMNDKDIQSVSSRLKDGQVKLTDDDKKVKPTYLLSPNASDDLVTIGQKYSALAMLLVDKEVSEAFDMDVTAYQASISKLTSEINDPAFKTAQETEGDIKAKSNVLYKEMEAEGRINFYWIATSAFVVENLYITCQNIEKFVDGYTDDQVAAITFRLWCVIDAMDRLSVYDPQIPGIAEALAPLKDIDATTVADFKKQLADSKEKIEASRAAFLK